MRQISSNSTSFSKRTFPCIWFGGVALFACAAVLEVIIERDPTKLLGLIAAIAMAVFGYLLMRALVFDLVDEVYFDGNEFVVRNAGQEDRFTVSEVINVDVGECTESGTHHTHSAGTA